MVPPHLPQVAYTYHTYETLDPQRSCDGCSLDDTLTVVNRHAGAVAGDAEGFPLGLGCACRLAHGLCRVCAYRGIKGVEGDRHDSLCAQACSSA